jgi:hypothetical protein
MQHMGKPGDHHEVLSPATPREGAPLLGAEDSQQAGGPGGGRDRSLLRGASVDWCCIKASFAAPGRPVQHSANCSVYPPTVRAELSEVLAAGELDAAVDTAERVFALPDIAPPAGWEERVHDKLRDRAPVIGGASASFAKAADATRFTFGPTRHSTAEELGLPPDPPDHQPGRWS